MNRLELLEALLPAAQAAGRLIEEIRKRGVAARSKADESLVTQADEAAETLIESGLRALEPGAHIVGEEAHAAGKCPEGGAERFWLIDPLDGTKGFVGGEPDYTVNIGLIEHGAPVLGVVLTPRDGTLWAGGPGLGAFRQLQAGARTPIAIRPWPARPAAFVSKNSFNADTQAFLDQIGDVETVSCSSSLKFCRVAEGAADVYPRFAPTCEWDTAAGHAVLLGAGGGVDWAGAPLKYGKPKFLNAGFVAFGARPPHMRAFMA